MKNCCRTLLIIFLSSVPAIALADGSTVGGSGAMTCADLANAVKKDGGAEYAKFAITQWLYGFLTAENFSLMDQHKKEGLYDISNLSVSGYSFIAKYCDNHPLGQVSAAVGSYVASLPKTNSPSPP